MSAVARSRCRGFLWLSPLPTRPKKKGASHLPRGGVSCASLFLLVASAPPATLGQLEDALAATPSASEALEGWCHARFDPAGTLRASVITASSESPTSWVRHELRIGKDEALGYRRVRLSCAGRELSMAFNWYVPDRLTPEMNAALAQTDQPFGLVAAPLGFTRQRLSGQRGRADYCPEGTILTQRAMLKLRDGRPLALVIECYTEANLAP